MREFRFSEEVHFEIRQFTDNTMLISDGSTENLWSIKAILRGFKFASGLHVNLNKSHTYGVNLVKKFCKQVHHSWIAKLTPSLLGFWVFRRELVQGEDQLGIQ